MGLIIAMLVLCVTASYGADGSEPADQRSKSAVRFFLDRVPTDMTKVAIPDDARDVVVAKVRLTSGPFWVGGRDQSGRPPPPTKDIYGARLKIVEVYSGSAKQDQEVDVWFLTFPERRPSILVLCGEWGHRDYVVVMYTDVADNEHRLVPFPIDYDEYLNWQKLYLESLTPPLGGCK
ncbi:hypothetical protein [Bradyrhizobium sp. SZCCHNS2005]|uniref:hypothetical protein n=1 Tax=Bradyrhizobium sp. SZCCHNS2005 TaxID=3057303 RepID=UPI0028EDEDF3|nr:hypothetical protein [Bradyrhizobium sp. SZCCHNS2005]